MKLSRRNFLPIYTVKTIFLTICFLVMIKVMVAVNVTELRVPSIVKHGSNAELLCFYKLQRGESIYSVNWYKENFLFYRYQPRGANRVQYFTLPGIVFDIQQTNSTRIVLRNVNDDTSGNFTCEVSVLGTLHTDLKEAMMLVQDTSSAMSRPWNTIILNCMAINFFIAIHCYR
ncbi:uncharacterized protein LOC141855939 [Brevipalpus obovatus]|uniref:uncharacterized protein LOC141855939 n=1 Tax=Brevipalpus obovatus TaxID=246614 RepID=UPI003D9F48BF